MSDWFIPLKRLARFFSRPNEKGYGFCVAKDQRQMTMINQQIINQAKRKVKIVSLESDISIMEQLRQVVTQSNTAIIVHNLDFITSNNPEKLQELNFSREALYRLNVPIIFWVTETLLGQIANRAADLFSQRQISTLYFVAINHADKLPEDQAIIDEVESHIPVETDEMEKLLLRANTLEEQVQAALYQSISKTQIAQELILSLVKVRNDLYQHDRAIELLKKWQAYFDKKNAKTNLDIGMIWEEAAELEAAQKYYQVAQLIYKKQLEKDTNHQDLQYNLGIVYSRLGNIQSRLGNLGQALEYFKKFTQLMEELYEAYPSNVSFKNGLAISYCFLGNTHSSLGDLEKALINYELYAKLQGELYSDFPTNVKMKNDLAISYEKLGETQSSLGNLSKALEYFEQRSKLGEELYAAYPSNVSFKNGLAVSYYKLAQTYTSVEEKKVYFKKAEKLWQELVLQAPAYVQFQKYLEIVQNILSKLEEDN